MKTKNDYRIRFNIVGPPQKHRKRFSLRRDVVDQSPQRNRIKSECFEIKDERIDAINLGYNKGNGNKTLAECLDELKKIKAEYEKKENQKISPIAYYPKNLKLVDSYMEKIYKRRKCKETSKKSMQCDLLRAVKTLKNQSLYACSEDTIQEMIDTNSKNPTQQRRNIMRMRQLLKFIGRTDVQISMEDEEDKLVKHLTLEELNKLISSIKNDEILKLLITIGGLTGLRQSEIFGLRRHQVKRENSLLVDSQLLPDGTRCLPKNKKKRMAVLLPGAAKAILRWLEIPQEEKEAYRAGGKTIPNAVAKKCRELWPKSPEKHLNFRDLRHIIGVHMASKGVPTDLIAKSMGNTPEVSRKHYQGFMINDIGIDTIQKILLSA